MNRRETFQLGDVIEALYDEASKVTSDTRIRAVLTYLALIDLQGRPRLIGSSRPEDRNLTAA